MTDKIGLVEHAVFTAPHPDSGYCVGDVARGLTVLSRAEPSGTPEVIGPRQRLARTYLTFVRRAQQADGRVLSRRRTDGVWPGAAGVDDAWGLALWGLGTATSRGQDPELAFRAAEGFHLSAALRSPWPRSMAFAGLGAAEVLRVDSANPVARALLADAARAVVSTPTAYPAWPWPQARLTYANAVIPDVLMAAGDALNEPDLVEHGVDLLDWLLDVESAPGHLSMTPLDGWAPGEPRPGFNQRPLEVSTLTDACARAYELTESTRWSDGVRLGAAWFHGDNDNGSQLVDDVSGGCSDSLQRNGCNQNQGSQSTVALISTLQHAERLERSR